MINTEIAKDVSGMKETFNIEDAALITGLSTRTIRSFISNGFIEGDKTDEAKTAFTGSLS